MPNHQKSILNFSFSSYTVVMILISSLSALLAWLLVPSHPPVLASYPHQETLFTQGIYFRDGAFIESSGAPEFLSQTENLLGISDMSGNFSQRAHLEKPEFFGEGIAELAGNIYWLTWKNGVGFRFDAESFEKRGEWRYQGEWWWLTTDGTHLIMSDGSSHIRFLHPDTQHTERILVVTESGFPVHNINELEYIRGRIFANIWLTNDIIIIHPKTGAVEWRYHFDFLARQEKQWNPGAQEMNGIAFDEKSGRIFLTGKMWKYIYAFDISHFEP